jgi:hypothetical protein
VDRKGITELGARDRFLRNPPHHLLSILFIDMSPPPFHALILGASGISGWALLNQARLYPSPDTFHRITGTTNRPLSLEKAQIPPDPRVRLVSGIDFTKSVEEVRETLREKIPDVDTVTHVFFTGMHALGLRRDCFSPSGD